jgi:hypothetical protein
MGVTKSGITFHVESVALYMPLSDRLWNVKRILTFPVRPSCPHFATWYRTITLLCDLSLS